MEPTNFPKVESDSTHQDSYWEWRNTYQFMDLKKKS